MTSKDSSKNPSVVNTIYIYKRRSKEGVTNIYLLSIQYF